MELHEEIIKDLKYAADQDPSLTTAVVFRDPRWGLDFETFSRYTDALEFSNKRREVGIDTKVVNLVTL